MLSEVLRFRGSSVDGICDTSLCEHFCDYTWHYETILPVHMSICQRQRVLATTLALSHWDLQLFLTVGIVLELFSNVMLPLRRWVALKSVGIVGFELKLWRLFVKACLE